MRRKQRFAAVILAAALSLAAVGAVQAQLLPTGFFDHVPTVGSDNVGVTADQLTYDADTHQVLADGGVEVNYQGYHITGDHLVFDQRAHTAHFIGNAVVHSPDGTVYRAPDMVLTSAMHEALMRQLTITTAGGGLVTAGDGDFRSGDKTVLNDATYAPCGDCIDAKGHRIGWSAKATRMVYDHHTSNVTLNQPTLYLLGVPVAWLPWLSMPDPTKRTTHLQMPSFGYTPQVGARVNLPYFIAAGEDTDIILTPSLMSRQGFLMAGEVDQRFPDGAIRVRASGIYQRDPDAFVTTTGAPEVGDRPWRGAIQTAGAFTPVKSWTVGWSYAAFTDVAYFTDYSFSDADSETNEVYATQLTQNEFFDFRLQKFNVLGDVTPATAQQQAAAQATALPNARYRNVLYLPRDFGEIDLSAELLGAIRDGSDARGSAATAGVPYDYGYQETKTHGTVEADWQKRWIAPGGFVITPLAGLRADAAYYNGASPLKPDAVELFNATPIAAVDVRFPMIADSGWATHLLEPIGQLVYRGSDVTDVGITNDNAQSFILEDTNLFSYNRFSGTDRQETGLRANVGAHYQLNLAGGGWLDLIGGESFQLAGVNAFAQADPTQVTTGRGMSTDASYVVMGAQGSVLPGLVTGAKLQLNPNGWGVTRGGFAGSYAIDNYLFNLDYLYVAKDLDRGVLADQQEVSAGVTVPVPFVDYWKVNASAAWDLTNSEWLAAGAGVHYDDGYLRYGADVTATGPTNTTPNNLTVTASFFLKGLGGMSF